MLGAAHSILQHSPLVDHLLICFLGGLVILQLISEATSIAGPFLVAGVPQSQTLLSKRKLFLFGQFSGSLRVDLFQIALKLLLLALSLLLFQLVVQL